MDAYDRATAKAITATTLLTESPRDALGIQIVGSPLMPKGEIMLVPRLRRASGETGLDYNIRCLRGSTILVNVGARDA